MKRIFLGGTCNNSTWREELISKLTIDYFNPVVKNWTPDCQAEELKQRDHCDYCLYVITPRMTGCYSVAEAVDDSNKRPEKTIFCVLERDGGVKFDEFQMKSFRAMESMITKNGGKVFDSLDNIALFLNM